MKKSWFFIAAVIVLFSAVFLYANDVKFFCDNTPPEPRLLYPISDKVELAGKDFLEFRWINDYAQTSHYVFRIYKGYNTYESGLVNKQNVGANESSIKVKLDFFENGQVYTWTLMQVDLGGRKSERSFNSFKVIK